MDHSLFCCFFFHTQIMRSTVFDYDFMCCNRKYQFYISNEPAWNKKVIYYKLISFMVRIRGSYFSNSSIYFSDRGNWFSRMFNCTSLLLLFFPRFVLKVVGTKMVNGWGNAILIITILTRKKMKLNIISGFRT